jgi:hypothetical protein
MVWWGMPLLFRPHSQKSPPTQGMLVLPGIFGTSDDSAPDSLFSDKLSTDLDM